MSSLASKITLAVCFLLSAGTIGYVHYKQRSDMNQLHEGVIKDLERRERRKAENIYKLQQQQDLTKQLNAALRDD